MVLRRKRRSTAVLLVGVGIKLPVNIAALRSGGDRDGEVEGRGRDGEEGIKFAML